MFGLKIDRNTKTRCRSLPANHSRRRNQFALRIERLEVRELLAGDVLISISDAIAMEATSGRPWAFVDAVANVDFPRAIVVNSGDLLVASATENSVLKYEAESGSLLGTFIESGSGGLVGPFDMAFGPDGNFYVSSFNGLFAILRYDGATGAFLDTFVTPGSGGLTSPTGLVFDAAGDLLVSSYYSGQVLKYRGPNNASEGQSAGEPLGEFAFTGTGSGPDYLMWLFRRICG